MSFDRSALTDSCSYRVMSATTSSVAGWLQSAIALKHVTIRPTTQTASFVICSPKWLSNQRKADEPNASGRLTSKAIKNRSRGGAERDLKPLIFAAFFDSSQLASRPGV